MPDQTRFFEGWIVVAAVFVVLMVSSGLGFYGLPVYLEAITDEHGLSVSAVSFATSLFFIVGGITGRLVAPVIERHDIRFVIAAGAMFSGVGLLLVGRSTRLLTLYPSYVIFAIGFGLCGLVPGTTLVTRWFHERRSVALSVASTGLSFGGLTFTVFAAWWIQRHGMAGATPLLALMVLVVPFLALRWMWPDPTSRNQVPDGRRADAGATGATPPMGITYEEAIRTPFYRLVTLAFVFAMAAQVGAIAQLAKMGAERVDSGTGALLVSVVAGTSVIARLIGGVVAARVSLILMTAVLAIVQGFALWWLSTGDSRSALIPATVVFGATIGNLLMLQPLVLADRFGVVNYPRIYALSQLVVTGLGVAGGPYLLGLLRDLSSYELSYIVAAAASVVGGAVFFAAWAADRRTAPALS